MNKNYDSNNQQNLNNNNNDFTNNSESNNHGNIPNMNNNKNNHVVALASSCKILSITYIMVWVLDMLFMIGAVVCFDYFNKCVGLGITPPSYYSGASQYGGFIACIVFVVFLSIALLVLGIRLISKNKELKNYCNDTNNIILFFQVGLIFFGITSIVASFMTFSACSKIESQGSTIHS